MILQLEWKTKKKTELVLECKASTFEYSEFFSVCDPIHEEYFTVQQLGRIKENWQQLLYSQSLSIIKNAK